MARTFGAGLARLMATLVWAMEPSRLSAFAERVAAADDTKRHAEPAPAEVEHVALEAARGDGERMTAATTVAVIPMMGEVYPHENLFSFFFGGAVIDRMRAQLRKALADETVKAIVFKIDSPGGMVDGVPEFADDLFEARQVKPIVGMVDAGMAASAAYWLASQMTSISVTSSSQAGSIGVLSVHFDESGYLERLGVKPTIIRSSPAKAAANPYEPLSDEAKGDLQQVVDATAAQFRAAVARGRGVTAKFVKDSFGEGKVFQAKDAKALGMVDRIESFDSLVSRLAGTKSRPGAKADELSPALVAEDEARPLPAMANTSDTTTVDMTQQLMEAMTFDDDDANESTDVAQADADYLAMRTALAKHGLDA